MSKKPKPKRKPKQSDAAKKQAAAHKKQKRDAEHMPTANAKVIRDLMLANKVKGDYRDHVIIAGARLIDWKGSYDIRREDDGKTVGVNGMAIVHKAKLANIIGEEMASNFWGSVGRVGDKSRTVVKDG